MVAYYQRIIHEGCEQNYIIVSNIFDQFLNQCCWYLAYNQLHSVTFCVIGSWMCVFYDVEMGEIKDNCFGYIASLYFGCHIYSLKMTALYTDFWVTKWFVSMNNHFNRLTLKTKDTLWGYWGPAAGCRLTSSRYRNQSCPKSTSQYGITMPPSANKHWWIHKCFVVGYWYAE